VTLGTPRPFFRAAENPFRVERLHAVVYWDPSLDWETLCAAAERPGVRGALVGPHGNGKTTLLLELGQRLAARGIATRYVRVGAHDHAERRLRADPNVVFLVDGTEALSVWARWKLRAQLRRARGLVLTLHRPGRIPTLHRCASSTSTLEHLLQQLVPEDLEALRPRISAIYSRHHGDVRAMLFALYDEYGGGPPAET